ncbi:HAD family hydrolase [Alteribacillus iranensis]|uniref:Putative hydrolase of the HAD superfamily n=1 Tax=Alteribacillus iranensis TaxID=930128 RepID=A0A1I2BH30_9BACI|nr:HAD-IA family hydrolase [Alteribacillus iranensis]SFE55481.1 putative hydrolase of the HAD superfamily [Alteribacillus iranensis]
MVKTKAIIFDLDDTLISEKEYIKSGYKHISKILSGKLNKDENALYELLLRLLSKSSQNVFNRLLDIFEFNYTRNDIGYLVEEYRNHLPNIVFFDDVLPCLDILKDREVKTGIITDGYSNAQNQKIKVIGATNYFDKIIVTDELGREYWKPHPKSFEIMKHALDVEYDEMIYVGDNPKKDFYISRIYPIKTIRVQRENGVYATSEYYQGVKENITISTLKEINDVLNL